MKHLKKILAVMLVFICVINLSGCIKERGSKELQTVLDSLKKGDFKPLDKYEDNSELKSAFKFNNKEEEDLIKLYLSKLDYKVDKPIKKDGKYIIKCNFTYIDLETIAKNNLSADKISEVLKKRSQTGKVDEKDLYTTCYNILKDNINNTNIPKVSKEVDFQVYQGKNGLEFASADGYSSKLMDVFFGNLMKVADKEYVISPELFTRFILEAHKTEQYLSVSPETNEFDKQFNIEFYKNSNYVIKSTDITKDSVLIKFDYTCVDLEQLSNSVDNEIVPQLQKRITNGEKLSDEQIQKEISNALINKLKSPDVPKKTINTSMEATIDKEGLKFKENCEFDKAMDDMFNKFSK